MCLIIASPEGKVPTCGVIEQGWRDNSDGWGLMHSNGSEIIINKGLRFDNLKPLLEEINGSPYVLHYRWATHGTKNIDNCHPFRITKQLYMAHNGIIQIECDNKLMSDTWHFAKRLREIGIDSDAVKDKEVITMIEEYIGKGNKLAFLDSKGNISFANENSGMWQEGVWFSNGNSFFNNDWGWQSYYSRRYGKRSFSYSRTNSTSYANEVASKIDQSISTGTIRNDEQFYAEGSDLWDNCEYCNTLDWLEEAAECDGMLLCRPCRKVLSKLYADEMEEEVTASLQGINAGVFYDSNRVPYSWDDIDEKIEQVRNARDYRHNS